MMLFLFVSVGIAQTSSVSRTVGTVRPDACEWHEISSTIRGAPVRCLVYVSGKLNLKKPIAALVVFPDSANQVSSTCDRWSGGRVPATASMLIIIPEIDSDLPEDSAFALFSEVMHGIKERYPIDSQRLYLWGIGDGARQAFTAARCLPDKFAAIITPHTPVCADIGLLEFASLPISLQVAAVKRDPATYRCNLQNLRVIMEPGSVKSLSDLTPALWGKVCDSLQGITKPTLNKLSKVTFRTSRLRFNKCGWGSIINFRNWNLPGAFQAYINSAQGEPSRVICTTENIAMLTMRFPEKTELLQIDGDTIRIDPGRSATIQLTGQHWERINPPAVVVTSKHPDRAGPLNDTLFTPFVFVVGTQSETSAQLSRWAQKTAASMPRKNIRILKDKDVLEDKTVTDNYTLVCFGGAEENAVTAMLSALDLPGTRILESNPEMIHTYHRPSPFAVDRYVVVNVTGGSEAFRNPAKLQWDVDWVVYSGGDGRAVRAGSFNQDWEPQHFPLNPWREFGTRIK